METRSEDANALLLQKSCQELHASFFEAIDKQRRTQEMLFERFLQQVGVSYSGEPTTSKAFASSEEEHTEEDGSLKRLPEASWKSVAWSPDVDGPTTSSSAVNGGDGAAMQTQTAPKTKKGKFLERLATADPRNPRTRRQMSMNSAASNKTQHGMWSMDVFGLFPDHENDENLPFFVKAIIRLISWWKDLKEPRRSGLLHRFVISTWFNALCMIVILGNGFFIIRSTNAELLDSSGQVPQSNETVSVLLAIECGFLGFYVIELGFKLANHGWYFFANQEATWNTFDFFLVCVSLLDLAVTLFLSAHAVSNVTFIRAFRLLKITKVFRLFRALKFISELRLMLDLLLGCYMSLMWAMILLAFLMCLFAIFFVQGFSHYVEDNLEDLTTSELDAITAVFGSVGAGMESLFEASFGGVDWNDYYEIVKQIGTVYSAGYIFYIMFMAISVMNIVTSLFVDRAMKLAKPTDDQAAVEKEQDNIVACRALLKLCQDVGVDQDGDGFVTAEDLKRCMQDPRIREHFEVRDMGFRDTDAFFKMLSMASEAAGTEGVELYSFVKGCVRLKGTATSMDLHTLAFEVKLMHRDTRRLHRYTRDEFLRIGKQFSTINTELGSLAREIWDIRNAGACQPGVTKSAALEGNASTDVKAAFSAIDDMTQSMRCRSFDFYYEDLRSQSDPASPRTSPSGIFV